MNPPSNPEKGPEVYCESVASAPWLTSPVNAEVRRLAEYLAAIGTSDITSCRITQCTMKYSRNLAVLAEVLNGQGS